MTSQKPLPDTPQSEPTSGFDQHEGLRLLAESMRLNRPCENCGGPRTAKDVSLNSVWCKACRKLVHTHYHADAHGNRF